ncbi:MAG: hypothetical protein NT022_13475 [Deltaproteobacteria bacterium]|nr:hypothetical protein [Deltaproteobacteria bacterium]
MMNHKQDWFEMADIRRRKLNSSVWIPLRAIQDLEKKGQYGYLGYRKEFFGLGTVAVPIDQKDAVSKLGWEDIGISHNHSGYFEDGRYVVADVFEDYDGTYLGTHLVLDQHFNSVDPSEWYLNQDFVTALALKRENDVWVRPSEGYIEVARLLRGVNGRPILLEARAEHLKDYLCARNMGLYATSYRNRDVVTDDVFFITWENRSSSHQTQTDRWEGRVVEIHEGGHPFGEKIAVFHGSRTDIDESDDIPDISALPTDENTESSSWEKTFDGKKLFMVMGELWRDEWIEPASTSPRIRHDAQPPSVFFITDEQGNKETKETLSDGGRWLWFKPDVIMALTHRRGGSLAWYTRDTGSVRCSPDCGVHFGVNRLSLINVYAKDVVLLPEWQQRIWAGFNVGPEGGVSEELLASQVRANPARTQAPEEFLGKGLELLNVLSYKQLGIFILKDHDFIRELLPTIHRFRAVDSAGLYSLAKDVARVTADSLDTAAMQNIVRPPKNAKWGSLKTLENLIASTVGADAAHFTMSALVGVYELRHADAHLPGNELDEALTLVGVDRGLPSVLQGYQLLHAVVSSIFGVVKVLQEWIKTGKE